MKITKTVRTALEALRRNLTRAILTALGIIIGIASVIVMVEIGQGSSSAIQRTIASMGANNILIFPGTAASGGVSFGIGSTLTLTADDAAAILQEVPTVRTGAPIVRARGQIVYGNRNWVPQNIQGSTPLFFDAREWTKLSQGDIFTERDVLNSNKVCVIGATIARELFGVENPVGKELRLQNITFKVVGVLSPKGASMMGSDQDDIIVAPWTTIKYRVSGTSNSTASTENKSTTTASSSQTSPSALYPATELNLYPQGTSTDAPILRRFANIDQIMVSARSAEDIPKTIDAITELLRERHHLRPDEPDDFIVRDMAEMTRVVSSTGQMMTKLLLIVACISLIVGGVGIMNIMLVSVTERTREIGLRMAVGARAKDILRQFLVEAVVLCLSGGALGILLGRGISLLVTTLLHWPVQASVGAVLGAFVVSVTVGLVFGYYPAARAAKLNPIEALRYE